MGWGPTISSLLFSFMLILFMPLLFIHWVLTLKKCGQNHGLKQNGPKSLVTQLMEFSKIPTISFFCSIHSFLVSQSFIHPSIYTTILFFWLIHSFISFFPPFIHSFIPKSQDVINNKIAKGQKKLLIHNSPHILVYILQPNK